MQMQILNEILIFVLGLVTIYWLLLFAWAFLGTVA